MQVGVNKDSYLVLAKLPAEYDARVQAMEVDERPTEEYSDVGGLDNQIQELIEAIVLPMTHKERFDKIGIRPPKGKESPKRAALQGGLPAKASLQVQPREAVV